MTSRPAQVSARGSSNAALWTVSRAINTLAWVISVWAIFYPHPYAPLVILLLAMPWAAVIWVRKSHGLFRIDQERRHSRPNVATPFVMPGMALLLRGLFDYHAMDWARLVFYGIVVGSLLCVAAVTADSSIHKWRIALYYTLTFFYGAGGAAVANGFFDFSTPASYPAEIRDKRVVHGRATYYQLTLAPWGPRKTENSIQISKELYAAVSVGDSVCANIKHGALGVPWYEVTTCQ